MMPRVAGASLGLLAFTISLVGGLLARNPATVTLSRGILALFLFFLIGLVLGTVAQRVIREYERQRKEGLQKILADGANADEADPDLPDSTRRPSASIAT